MERKVETVRKGGEENRSIFKSPKLSLLEMLLAEREKLEGEEMVEYFSRPKAHFLELLLVGNTAVTSKKPSQRESNEVKKSAGSGDEMMKRKKEGGGMV